MELSRPLSWLFLIVLLPKFIKTQNCFIQETSISSPCVCDYLDNRLNGWSYSCFNTDLTETLYIMQYVTDLSLRFECAESDPNYQSLFNQIPLGEIQTFIFKTCRLPNLSYSEIIPYREQYPIEQIRIEQKQDDDEFTAEIFGNMSRTIKNLILSGNRIETLPESLFQNFTVLRYLSLSNNKLQTIPEKLLFNTSNLVILEITNNVLESLPENVFQNLKHLEKLYLYKNKLKELPNGIFRNVVNLQVLDLADNNIVSLSNNIFNELSNLIHIRLRANWLSTVPSTLFKSSLKLQNIDISLNRFIEPLPENLFLGLTQLETLFIANCNFSQILENFFAHTPNLINLNLESNLLRNLPNNIFQNNSMLKEIKLNFNKIDELPSGLLSNQVHLEKLSLFKNNISAIPNGLFQRTKMLKTLVLGGNRIQNASEVVFQGIPDLVNLDLSGNQLTHFMLEGNENIKSIDLSYNNLTHVPSLQWNRHLRLEMLNLEHNNISFLSTPVLYSSNNRNPPTINLAYNNIKTVNVQDITIYDEELEKVSPKDYENYVETRVILNSNAFLCDCKMYEFYYYTKPDRRLPKRTVRFDSAHNLTCQEPYHLKGMPIMSLLPEKFTCELKENCSSPCNCYFRPLDFANVMNCSNSGLKNLPTHIPHNTNVLFFQENLLSSITEFNQEKWLNLSEIYLEANRIVSLDSWNIPTNLKNISLNGNHIKQLPSFFLEFISNAKQFQITLSDNPFNCNCSVISFKKWLAEHYQVVSDVKKVTCENRVEVNGSWIHPVILTTSDDLLCPLNDWSYKLHLITVTVICAVLALLLFIVSVLYYRNKQTIIAYVFIHMHLVFNCFFREEDMDEDKPFDAFVSYSGSDRDVALMLLAELEEKEPRFQLCIHERNWIAGYQISWNIFNSVQNSKRTILVISKSFLESMWFQVEFHTAYYQMLEDKIDRLIIIVKGQLPPKENMDKDLQYLLSTKTYLVWEEKWFWEKLKYALPHKKQQLPSSDVLALKDRPASKKIKPIDNQIAYLSSADHKTPDKVQEVIQNCTNSTVNVFQTNK